MSRSRRWLALTSVLTSLAMLGACSNDAAPGAEPRPSGSASTSASTSASASPAPSASTQEPGPRAEEEAFIREYFKQLNNAIVSGDTSRVVELSAADCYNCSVLIRNIAGAFQGGAYIEGGRWYAMKLQYMRTSKLGRSWDVRFRTARERWYDAQNDLVQTVRASRQHFVFVVDDTRGRLVVRGMKVVK